MIGTAGDLAARVAGDLRTDTVSPVAGDNALPHTEVLEEEQSGFLAKVRFSWRPEDRAIMERVRAAADAQFAELFGAALAVIDEFYASLRTPKLTEWNAPLMHNGRIVWETDEQGRVKEDFSRLTGQDVDLAILRLQKVLLEITPEVNRLMLEAVAAHNIAKDAFDEGWFRLVEGTQGDRTARANTEARVDRWHAYFRFYLWSTADAFLQEIRAFLRRLDNIGYREIRRQ